jgi:hypothetical protein
MTETIYNGENITSIRNRYVGLMKKFSDLQDRDSSLENLEAMTNGLYLLIRFIHHDIDIPYFEKERIIKYINICSKFIEENMTLDKIRTKITECLVHVHHAKCIDDLKFVQKLEDTYNKYQNPLNLTIDIESEIIGLDLLLVIIADETWKENLDLQSIEKIFDVITDFAGILAINKGETDFITPLYLS